MKTHLMLDFETLGQTADCIVLSLGVVAFNQHEILDERYWVFNQQDQHRLNRKVSESTVQWWNKQGDEARTILNAAATVTQRLDEQIYQVNQFCQGGGNFVWSNGADFDIPILESLFAQHGLVPPWKFWNKRCYRTVKSFFKIDEPFVGTKHNALADARHQAKCVQKFLRQYEQ